MGKKTLLKRSCFGATPAIAIAWLLGERAAWNVLVASKACVGAAVWCDARGGFA